MATPEAQATGEAPAKENQVALGSEWTRAPASPVQRSWLARHFSLLLRRDPQAQKAGQLFSGLLALNAVLLGGAFICSMVFNNVAVTLGDVWILLAALKVLSALWLLYYTAGTTRRPHAVLHRDPHAGPVWVRGECPGTRSGGGGWRWVQRPGEGQSPLREVPMAPTRRPARFPGALWQLHRLPQRLPSGLRREPHPLQVAAGAGLPRHRGHLHQRPGDWPRPPPLRTLCQETATSANRRPEEVPTHTTPTRHPDMPPVPTPTPPASISISAAHGVSETQTPIDTSASTYLNLHPHLDIQSFFFFNTIYFLFGCVACGILVP